MHIAQLYPNAPLLGLGFSLGANVVTRYLGEEGDLSRLHAACVLACVSFSDFISCDENLTLLFSLGISKQIMTGN